MAGEASFWHWNLAALLRQARKGRFEAYLQPRLPLALPLDLADTAGLSLAGRASFSGLVSELLTAARGRKDDLARLLTASAMLAGPECEVWDELSACLPEQRLGVLRAGRWRLICVPCVQDNAPMPVHLLCGHFPVEAVEESDSLALAGSVFFPVVDWAVPALDAARAKWDGHMVCRAWSRETNLAGTSLGLPTVLGLGCAAENLPLPLGLLATGAVDVTGRVTAVSGLEYKLCLSGGSGLLVPTQNWQGLGSEHKAKSFPAADVDQAWAFWKACVTGHGPARMFSLLSALDRPADLFPLLIEAALPELEIIAAPENRERLLVALQAAANPGAGLRPLLAAIVDSKQSAHSFIRRLLVSVFDEPLVLRVAEADRAVAWRLCMVHIRACNHTGQPEAAQRWLELSRPWSRELHDEDVSEEMVSHALSVVGLLHNTFRFQEDPLRMVGADFHGVYDQVRTGYERRRRSGSHRANHALGSWSGTLAQHHAFRREWDKAETHLDAALGYFEGDAENQAQELCYRFFMRLDAGRPEVRHDLLCYLGLEELNAGIWHFLACLPAFRRPWTLHALTRYLAASPTHRHPAVLSGLSGLFQELESQGTLLGLEPAHHPWQLILYNLGFLADSTQRQADMWNQSARLCRAPGCGPTIQVMALLPFSALHAHGHALPTNVTELVDTIRATIRATLDTRHFAPILSAPDWATVLERAALHQAELFPFNYR